MIGKHITHAQHKSRSSPEAGSFDAEYAFVIRGGTFGTGYATGSTADADEIIVVGSHGVGWVVVGVVCFVEAKSLLRNENSSLFFLLLAR